MLSEQFNTSNESVFKVRGMNAGHLGAGDSTFRGYESAQDDAKDFVSESEDGWYERNRGDGEIENKMDDISEHSSDYVTDSDPEDQNGETAPAKVKKVNGEKKKKKKKKKVEDEAAQG